MSTLRTILASPALVVGFVTAALAVAVAFHLPLTDEQAQAILGLVSAGVVLAGAVFVHNTTTPNGAVAAQLATVTAPQPDPTLGALTTPAPETIPTVPDPAVP